jgi:hypothetical protein
MAHYAPDTGLITLSDGTEMVSRGHRKPDQTREAFAAAMEGYTIIEIAGYEIAVSEEVAKQIAADR